MAVGSDVMKAITQSSEPGEPGPIGALSLKRARHCCASLSLSCRCAVDERLSARWLAADPGRGPKSSISSCLASARKSAVSSVTLTHDSSHRSPSESSPSHSTSTSNGRPRRPSCLRTALMPRTAHRPPSSASTPARTGPMAMRRRTSRRLRVTSCRLRFRCATPPRGATSSITTSPTSSAASPLWVCCEATSPIITCGLGPNF